jgi:cytochrome c oxidase assembly factor CtaG
MSILVDWDADPLILVPLLLAGLLYAVGIGRLWRRAGIGHGIAVGKVGMFAAGWLLLLIALSSPLHELADRLFAAHMVEHEILMAAAAPFLVPSRPLPAYLWSLPRSLRAAIATSTPSLAAVWRVLAIPVVATVVHGSAIWLWHVPIVFAAAVDNRPVHLLQHASFLGTALLFWWAMFRRRERGYGGAVGHLFATSMHTGLLGALLVLSPRAWFTAAGGLGFTPLEDQQLGGLIMWVPGCMVYAGVALVLAGKWILASGARQPQFMAPPKPQPRLS